MEQEKIYINSYMDEKTYIDFYNFNTFYYGHRWVGVALFPIIMVILAFVNLFTGSIPLFILFFLIGILIPPTLYLFNKQAIKNQIKANRLDVPKLAYSLTLTEELITAEYLGETVTFTWDKVYRVFKHKEYIYLYVTKARAFIIPFKDLDTITPDELWTFFLKNTPKTRIFPKK